MMNDISSNLNMINAIFKKINEIEKIINNKLNELTFSGNNKGDTGPTGEQGPQECHMQ